MSETHTLAEHPAPRPGLAPTAGLQAPSRRDDGGQRSPNGLRSPRSSHFPRAGQQTAGARAGRGAVCSCLSLLCRFAFWPLQSFSWLRQLNWIYAAHSQCWAQARSKRIAPANASDKLPTWSNKLRALAMARGKPTVHGEFRSFLSNRANSLKSSRRLVTQLFLRNLDPPQRSRYMHCRHASGGIADMHREAVAHKRSNRWWS